MNEKSDVTKKILKSLEMCKVDEIEEYLQIELPLILHFNQQLLTLRLYPLDDGYYVSTTDTMFDEYPEYSENYSKEYYDLFTQNNSHHYNIKQDGAYFYKKYDSDYSARCAIDDFVKFFVYFDEFILDYFNKK